MQIKFCHFFSLTLLSLRPTYILMTHVALQGPW